MASFRCYGSSNVFATLIMTNFPLYLKQLWWQFFPNACLWRRSLCSNSAGIDSEKLYRATFICQYGLFCCMALVSFRLFCKNLGNLQQFFGQMDYRPPWPKMPVRLCILYYISLNLSTWDLFSGIQSSLKGGKYLQEYLLTCLELLFQGLHGTCCQSLKQWLPARDLLLSPAQN